MSLMYRIKDRLAARLGMHRTPQMVADLYPQYQVGRGSYGPLRIVSFGEPTTFRMGAYCSVAEGASVFLGGGHRTEWVTTYPFSVLEPSLSDVTGHPVSKGDVTIGNDVWLGSECLILSGVTIGDGAVIAARAVVSKDVPAYAIVAGMPGEVIRYRFDEPTIARLLALRWWDWPHERIVAAGRHLLSSDITGFLDKAERGAF